MKRRTFIKRSALVTTAVIATPWSVLSNDVLDTASLDGVNLVLKESNLAINIPTNKDGYISVNEVYIYIRDLFRNDDELVKYPFPMIAITQNAIEVINDWEFTERSFNHLNGGSITIQKTGEHYTGLCILGHTMDQFDTKLEIDGKIYDHNNIIANIENKDINAVNAAGTRSKCIHEYVGRYDKSTKWRGVLYVPPIFFNHVDLSKKYKS